MHNWSLVLKRNAELYPDKEALIGLGKRLTWSQLSDRVDSLAQGLLNLGLGKGDIVAILLNNCLEWIELTFAVNQIGAAWLPMNYRLSSNEFAYILHHAEVKAIVSEPDYIPLITAIADDKIPTVKHRINVDPSAVQGWSSYNEMVDKNVGAKPDHAHVGMDDMHRLMYTSGTTALPKGVILSYSNLYWKNIAHVLYLGLSNANRHLVVAPLYHVGGMDACATSVLYVGGSLVILKRFDVIEILKSIEKEKVTDTMLTPAMCIMTFNEPTFEKYDVSSIEFVIDGGEKMPLHMIMKFKEKFPGAWFADAYGMTETLSCDTFLAKDKMLSKLGSVGRPAPHVSIRILDDDDNEVPRGELGEVCMKGPKVTKGYWKDPETTATVIKDGWLHSGDIEIGRAHV
jgi:acyl-CoA synthetase (AMP-forming)/AMP-acid ligase II